MHKQAKALKQVERQLAPELKSKYGLMCRQLPFDSETAALYVAKAHWTNRFDENRALTVGIFYSVWLTPELKTQRQFAYNIHALKLRKLKGYALTSRQFALEFRQAVAQYVTDWPNITLDLGPLTLLEGREQYDPTSFEEKVTARVLDFVALHHTIDQLLGKRVIA